MLVQTALTAVARDEYNEHFFNLDQRGLSQGAGGVREDRCAVGGAAGGTQDGPRERRVRRAVLKRASEDG